MNLFEIFGLTTILALILSISIIVGFFVIVSKVSEIARDTETIKNYILIKTDQIKNQAENK